MMKVFFSLMKESWVTNLIVFFVTNFKSKVEVFLEFSSFKLNKFSYKEALSFKCEIICSTKDSLNFEKS